jgi:hypothetical protein
MGDTQIRPNWSIQRPQDHHLANRIKKKSPQDRRNSSLDSIDNRKLLPPKSIQQFQEQREAPQPANELIKNRFQPDRALKPLAPPQKNWLGVAREPPPFSQETTRNPRGSLRKAPSFASIPGCRHLGMDLAPVNRPAGRVVK